MEYLIIYAKIADLDQATPFRHCPFCKKPTTISIEISGPLINWHQCQDCKTWFNPEIKFLGESLD